MSQAFDEARQVGGFPERPGREGQGAHGQYIYENDVGRKEGARAFTSVGRFVGRC